MTAVIPLPIFQGIDKITDVELGTPGQLVLDEQGNLLIQYLKYAGFTLPYQMAYDNWLQNILPLQVKTFTYSVKNGIISVVEISYRSPYNDNTKEKPIYPKQARENESTYELTIMVKYKFTPIERNFVNGEWKNQLRPDKAEISKDVIFGKIPLMLGTQYCHLYNKTDRQLVALGECHNDPLGYFIINGSERLILLQEKVRVNKIMTTVDKNSLNTVTSSYTINTYKGPKKIHVLASKYDEFQLHIVGIPSSSPMNLLIAFRFLGINDASTVIGMIKYFIPEKYHRKMDSMFILTISEAYKNSDIYEYTADLIGEAKTVPREDKITKINNILSDNLYPNMNLYNNVTENNFIKAVMLAQQTSHLVQYKLGAIKLDDRDNYANKRIESAGRSMEQLFTSLLMAYVSKTQSELDQVGVKKEGLNALISFDKNFIGNNFEKAFGNDSWGAPGTSKTDNIVDLLKRESVNSTLAQLTRINTPTNKNDKSIELRLVQPSQTGYICLTGDTEVLLADGITTKKISDMSNDDRVLTINPETLQEEASDIKGYFKIIPKRVLKINTLSDREVKCSPDHPFLVARENKFEWVHAGDLKVGDNLIIRDDYKVSSTNKSAMKYTEFTNKVSTYHNRVFVPITSIEDTNIEPVYDFTTISENHSFYANGIVVKNCPVSSPEGERAGLIKSVAVTCFPSIEKSDTLLIATLNNYRYNLATLEEDTTGEYLINSVGRIVNSYNIMNFTPQKSYLLMINGIPRGWVDPNVAYSYIVGLKRKAIYPELAVVKSSKYKIVDVYTDGARPLRPLLIVDPVDHQVIAVKNGYLDKTRMNEIIKTGNYIQFLMKNGALEYIDAYEQDESVIISQTLAQINDFNINLRDEEQRLEDATEALISAGITDTTETKDDVPDEYGNLSAITVQKRDYNKLLERVRKIQNRPRFTHCELDPTAILGQTASAIPLASSNVAPRNQFTVGMINQSLGIYHSNQSERFDTGVKTLAFPTRPMFETQVNELMGTAEMPYGQTIRVALMSWTGFNQEDAFIFNRQSIDLGLFTTVKFFTYKTSINDQSNEYIEKYKRPNLENASPQQREKMEHKLRNIAENGFPFEGSFLEEGDVVISKVRIIEGKEIFVGQTINIGDEGTVHRVRISKNTKKNEVGRVMLRQIRKPEVGDKFASRSAQKGTIGLILPPEDMPVIASGVDAGLSPDIIINSHSLPSRMTIGKMVEIVASKVGIIRGQRMDATSFRPIDHNNLAENLRNYGFNSKGNETMYSGMSGKYFPTEIFIGPCYYSSLGKDVKDKIQARSKASVDPSSHEPTRGRTNASGRAVRVGTQEATSFVGHGAPSILRERLNDSSDGYKAPYCKTCGTIAIYNAELKKISCKKCKDKENFGSATIPGSFKLITQILYGLNINQTLGLSSLYEK
jgi:DNA-directed RNA polymerase subunit B'